MLNPKRERIQDDLRGLVDGDVFTDTASTQAYATDASLYEISPICVVCPKNTMDVVSVIRYARKNGLTVHPRGAGSSCVGAALGEGIILDMSRYMRRLLFYEQESNVLHVQAGMLCSKINEILRPKGRQFVAGTGNLLPNTLGGVISTDGYGSHWLAFGRPSDWLKEVEIVTANGNIISFTDQEMVDSSVQSPIVSSDGKNLQHIAFDDEDIFNPEKLAEPEPFIMPQEEKKWILSSVNSLLNAYRDSHGMPVNLRVIDKMGYRTNIQNGNLLNMARMIAGAEGTLGVITAMKLKLPEIMPVRKTILLLFSSMEKATQAIPFLLPFHPEACELIDRRHLHLAAEHDVRFDVMFSDETEAVLLVDFSDTSQFNMLNRVRAISEQLVRQKELASQLISSVDETEATFFWELSGTFEPSARQGRGKTVRVTIVEDVAVAPTKLHEFFLKTQEILRKHGLTAAFYAHAIQGQVRLQPLADMHSPTDAAHVMCFAHDYYQLVNAMHGTIGTEKGLGLGWQFWTPLFSHEKYKLTCEIKNVFDPFHLFQPGKMGTENDTKTPVVPELLWRRAIRPESPFSLLIQTETQTQTQAQTQAQTGASTSNHNRNEKTSVSQAGNVSKDNRSNDSVLVGGVSIHSVEESASGMFAMEKVREILGSAFDSFGEELYRNTPAQKETNSELDETAYESLTSIGLGWNAEQVRDVTDHCNGCAKCRVIDQLQRMCPLFRYDCNELSSPRAKVNLMKGILNETLDLTELGDEQFHKVFHRCFQCHSCRIECPSGVDIPFLVRRAEESWAKARGLNFYETSLVRLDTWIKRFRHVPWLMNLMFSTGWLRWILEKTFGIAHDRVLPQMETHSFIEKLRKNPALIRQNPFETPIDESPNLSENVTEIQGRVVYFPDVFANHFEQAIARATVRVFSHNNVPIEIPPYQDGSGTTAVMLGRSDYVRKQVYRNAALLADYVRQGYDVVFSEPATTLAFRWEFPQTYPENEDIQFLPQHCFDVGEYLYKIHVLQLLKMPPRTVPMKVGYHAPCRLRALKIGFPSLHLMRLIPGIDVQLSPHGCCGMGGPYGMLTENYSMSQKIGRPLQTWLRTPTLQVGATECSACQLQMMQNNTKPVLHPIQILAQSYGYEE